MIAAPVLIDNKGNNFIENSTIFSWQNNFKFCRFCHSQSFNEWQCDLSTKDLARHRNTNIDFKFWRKTSEYPTVPLACSE